MPKPREMQEPGAFGMPDGGKDWPSFILTIHFKLCKNEGQIQVQK